jgi:hypothetical protein
MPEEKTVKLETPDNQDPACGREGEDGVPIVLDPPPGPSQ